MIPVLPEAAGTIFGSDSPHRGEVRMNEGPAFERYIGVDYSGAETPASSLRGLRAYSASRTMPATEVAPPPGPRRYWTRRGLAEWLANLLLNETPTLVGIDHGFSFPLRYFEEYGLSLNWSEFLDDFQQHWPTDDDIYVDFVREGVCGNGSARVGKTTWRRVTEIRARGAKSVFHFDVQGSVAKSTHSGTSLAAIYPLADCRSRSFLAFSDGWQIPPVPIRRRGSLSGTLWSWTFPKRRSRRTSARRLFDQPNGCAAQIWMVRFLHA